MSGAAGELIAPVMNFLSQFRLGRILMLTVASLIALLALPQAPRDRRTLLALAAVIAVMPLIYAFVEWSKSRPAAIGKWFLIRLAVVGVFAGGALLVLGLLRRRRETGEQAPPPPLPEEVDRLAHTVESRERAA